MKTLGLILACVFTSFVTFGQESETVSITVSINNISNNNGKVIVALHTADTFMKGPGTQNLESTITDGQVSFTFKNVAPGSYAIMALHDENENNRMDFEDNGMPLENYGTSGNDMSMGPPSFELSKFEVTNENLDLNIKF